MTRAAESPALFADARQEVIEALCDTDGMKWSEAADLVDMLVEVAPLRTDELIRSATLTSRRVADLEAVLIELLGWFVNEVRAGDEELARWADLIGTVMYPPRLEATS